MEKCDLLSERVPCAMQGAGQRQAVKLDAVHGREKGVRYWLRNGGYINTTFGYSLDSRSTLMMIAADNGHNDVIKALLDKGADVNQQDSKGRGALLYAVVKGQEERVLRNDSTKYEDIVTSLLLQGRADPNMQDEKGNTPLMHAAKGADVNMVRKLLKHGAKYSLQNFRGDIAMRLAAQSPIHATLESHVEVVNMLNAEWETHHALGTPPRRPNFSPQVRQHQSSEAGPSGPNTPPEGTRERPNPPSPPESKSKRMRTGKPTRHDSEVISPPQQDGRPTASQMEYALRSRGSSSSS